MSARVLVTGAGAICGAGRTPEDIWEAARAGRSAFAPIRQWDSSRCPVPLAAEVADLNPRELVADRKIHKLIQRTDLFGLYAADNAIDGAGLIAYRNTLAAAEADAFNERTAVYVGSGGATYQSNYDFFPLLTTAAGDLKTFGQELTATVNPMWLLRTLPNNVLCHIGIRHGFKGPNACITNHGVSGAQAVAEAAAALRADEADRAVAVGHHAGIEPQASLYLHSLGLLAADAVRPFDRARNGFLLGEGAAAMVLETAAAARARAAPVLGEYLGSGCAAEGKELLAVGADGDGLACAITLALDDAGIRAADVGMIVAHGNGTRRSDASEAAAIRHVFGPTPPPVTAFKWALGHLMAAAGVMDAVLVLAALRHRAAPGIATLRERDPDCAGVPVSAAAQVPRSDVAMVVSRGFAGLNVALLFRVPAEAPSSPTPAT